uniref:NADH-ubiquinone oxidoreductase chain 5 n=1 Tax=Aphelocheirus jendeki TaxID=2021939 RepID=A0A343ISA6_9HEMI|nr:NADH dehydrogenase subunit 5 [Aphelocheirus jendeki]AST10105.1 NADH dehydrogenase subunit 5 [Aphelocheirus jendeki]
MSFYNFMFIVLFIFGLIFWFLGFYFLKTDYLLFMDWELISINSCTMVMTFIFDWMSLLFSSCVLFISSMVILYSGSYMSSDIFKKRFLILVLMFVFSMFMMIISPNIISILIGWDGLGLVSYCLVIYFQNNKSYNAGMLTILTNRIGDVAILLSIAWMLNLGSWNYIYYTSTWENWMIYLLVLLVFAGFTKSAQIPFSSWLPAAMAAPTPVSALVHSSTLVTAGVYLLIRFSDLFLYMNCYFLILISVLTMFMSGLGASFEFDLKKIIALSTLSQLGLMMSILFLGFPVLAFFHLLTHAFFKALLFLCAGLMIHVMSDSQDIRHMGCAVNYLPFTCTCFCISSLSLCGFPFMAGFYSKDFVLETFVMSGYNLFIYLIFLISVGLTVSYSFRLIYYCMSDSSNMFVCQSYFEDKKMNLSMIFMTIMAIISGSMFMWIMYPSPSLIMMPFSLKFMPIIFVGLGSWLGYELSFYFFNSYLLSLKFYFISYFSGSMWFMPKFSTYMLYNPGLYISNSFSYVVDMGWGESIFSKYSLFFSSLLGKLNIFYQSNNIKLFMMTFFFILLFMLI